MIGLDSDLTWEDLTYTGRDLFGSRPNAPDLTEPHLIGLYLIEAKRPDWSRSFFSSAPDLIVPEQTGPDLTASNLTGPDLTT